MSKYFVCPKCGFHADPVRDDKISIESDEPVEIHCPKCGTALLQKCPNLNCPLDIISPSSAFCKCGHKYEFAEAVQRYKDNQRTEPMYW